MPPESRSAFQELVREIVDWRLAQFLERGTEEQDGSSGFTAKVSHAGGHPIVFLPDRGRTSGIPLGEPLSIEGENYTGRFVKIALNVIHKDGSDQNELPKLLRKWFGPDALRPAALLSYQRSLRPNWIWRAVVEVPVMAPAVPDRPVVLVAVGGVKTIRFGVLKLARFKRLKISRRN